MTKGASAARRSKHPAELTGWTIAKHSLPPGSRILPISRTARLIGSMSCSDIKAITRSALASSNGSAAASPIRISIVGSSSRAAATIEEEASIPMILCPSFFRCLVRRPSPQLCLLSDDRSQAKVEETGRDGIANSCRARVSAPTESTGGTGTPSYPRETVSLLRAPS